MNFTDYLHRLIPIFQNYFDELCSFDEYMDNLYTQIADELPSLEENIRDETVEIQTMLDFMLTGIEGSGVLPAIQNIESKIQENANFMKSYVDKYSQISENILKELDNLVGISKMIKEMKQISADIKIFSINSIIVSSRSGDKGIGFKSISRFITGLSDEIQKSAIQFEKFTFSLLEVHNSVKESFSYLLKSIYQEKIYSVQEDIITQIELGINSIKEIYRLLNDIQDRVRLSLQRIPEMMVVLQKQDIIKQSIEHIQKVFSQVLQEGNRFDELELEDKDLYFGAYLLYVIDKVNQDLKNLRLLIGSTNQEISGNFEKTYFLFNDANEDQKSIVNYLILSNYAKEQKSLISSIFNRLKNSFQAYENVLEEEVDAKSVLQSYFTTIEKLFHEGQAMLAESQKYIVKMNNINVLAQIEMNKNILLGSQNSAIRQKFNLMQSKLRDFNNSIKKNYKQKFNSLFKTVESFHDAQQSKGEMVSDNIHILEKESDRLDTISNVVSESLQNILNAGHNVLKMIEGSMKGIGVLSEMENKMNQMEEILRNSFSQFESELNQYLKSKNVSPKELLKNNVFIENILHNRVNLEKHIEASGDIEFF